MTPQPQLKVENVVCTGAFSHPLDPASIAVALHGSYNPKVFAACILRSQSPHTTLLLFQTGKAVVTGARSYRSAYLAMHGFAKLIQRCCPSVRLTNVTIRNIVFSTRFAERINLPGFAKDLGFSCAYDPELFPGLRITLKDPKIVVSVFAKGKAIMTGAKTFADAKKAWLLVAAGVEPHVITGNRATLLHRNITSTRQAFRAQAVVELTKKNKAAEELRPVV